MSKISELKGKIEKLEAMVEEKPMLQGALTEAKKQLANLEKEEKSEGEKKDVKPPVKKADKKEEKPPVKEDKKEAEEKAKDSKKEDTNMAKIKEGVFVLEEQHFKVKKIDGKADAAKAKALDKYRSKSENARHDVTIYNHTQSLLKLTERVIRTKTPAEQKLKNPELIKKAETEREQKLKNIQRIRDLQTILLTEIDLIAMDKDATSLDSIVEMYASMVKKAYKNDSAKKLVGRKEVVKIIKNNKDILGEILK